MFGARPETDRMARVGIFSNAAKTHQFSERIKDRFHSVGYTASFEKYTKSVKFLASSEGIENTNPLTVALGAKKKGVGGGLSERQLSEMRADEARLRAIEEQLEAIRERKRLKEQRERFRAERKRVHVSSVLIQNVMRRFMREKKGCAADAIVDFLRVSAQKQAITAAAWAITILRRFVAVASAKWLRYKTKKRIVVELSYSVLENVNEHVAEFARYRTEHLEKEAADAALKKNSTSKQLRSPKKSLKSSAISVARLSLSPEKSPPSVKRSSSSSLITSPIPQHRQQCTSVAAEAVAPTASTSSSSSVTNEASGRSKSMNIVNAANVPVLPNNVISRSVEINASVAATNEASVIVRKRAEEDERNSQQLLEDAHNRRLAEIDIERQRRLRLLEKSRLEQEMTERSRRDAENKELALKEKKRQDFIKKITEKEAHRAKQVARIREEKERKRVATERMLEKERETERRETQLMSIEDRLSYRMDLGRLLRDRALLLKKQDQIKRAKEALTVKVEAQLERKPYVPRLSQDPHTSAKVRKRLMIDCAARNKFDELDKDGSGFLEKKEIDLFMGEVFTVYGALEKTADEKDRFREDLMKRIDLNGDGKLDFTEFSRLWEDMREHQKKKRAQEREEARAFAATEEANKITEATGPSEAEKKEAGEREKQAARQRAMKRLQERISREKAGKAESLAAEKERKNKLDRVVEEAKKLVVAAPTRTDIRKQQIKKLLLRQQKTRESLEAIQEKVDGKPIEPHPEKAAELLQKFAEMHKTPSKIPSLPLNKPSVIDFTAAKIESPSTPTKKEIDSGIGPTFMAKNPTSKHPKNKFVSKKHKKIPIHNVKKKKQKLGRVASLLAMVERARRMLTTEPVVKPRYNSDAVLDELDEPTGNEYQVDALGLDHSAELRMSESWKRFARQHNYDDSTVLIGSVDDLPFGELQSPQYIVPSDIGDTEKVHALDLSSIDGRQDESSLGSNESGEVTYDIEWIRQQTGPNASQLVGGRGIDEGDDDEDDDDDYGDNDDREEAELNAECERLRQKLTSKMVNVEDEA